MATETGSGELIWAYLVHLGYNMWCDHEHNLDPNGPSHIAAKDYLRFDEPLWRELLPRMRDAGVNMVVIDIGEGLRYESHPELAVKGSWPREKLEEELAVCREFGLEPIPKLNFSACHDVWLGPYSRMLSTKPYYDVVRDVITEVSDIFKTPRFFHLSMDEETAEHQRFYQYCVIRQYDLWWHDFTFMAVAVEEAGPRPWIWSDYAWHHPEAFFEKMPQSVVQSNWYYGGEFKPDIAYVKAYDQIEAHGYDQIPTGSNWSTKDNFEGTVRYCSQTIPRERLKGFLQTVWRPTIEEMRPKHLEAIACIERARNVFIEDTNR